ncbi:MAG TPA: hypothetical protein VK468_02540 [Pyrinomonadaceae bacterium]|nr:hypothetical protein [Pyrinomonadaceae bacterium]
MSKKTITKISGFVICAVVAASILNGCSHVSSRGDGAASSQYYQKPNAVGRLENRDLKESSGLAASLCQPDVFWTHNDSGDGPFIFAIDGRGRDLGTWRVANAKNTDWEDIAASKDVSGKCFLNIGEIGNNKLERTEAGVYRVAEPTIGSETTDNKDPLETEPATLLRFRYPDEPHNAETLLENPQTGDFYVLTKSVENPASIFRIRPNFGSPDVAVAEKIGELAVPSVPNGLLTGGSISPDGKRVIICDYTNGYELVLPNGAAGFDEIWKQKPSIVDLGDRKQGEAVTYSADGKSIIAASEGKGAVIFEIDRK